MYILLLLLFLFFISRETIFNSSNWIEVEYENNLGIELGVK